MYVFVSVCLSLQLIIDTPTSPITSGLPLIFVITVTAIKQVGCRRAVTFDLLLFYQCRYHSCRMSLSIRVMRTGLDTKQTTLSTSVLSKWCSKGK